MPASAEMMRLENRDVAELLSRAAVELLAIARESGVRISTGSDAHAPRQLALITFGLAAALEAGIPRDRIVNFMPREALLAWTRSLTKRAS